LRDGISKFRFTATLAMLLAGNLFGVSLAFGQSDPMLNIPPSWDANHDGVYTCDEWKSFMDRLFVSADKGRKGYLTKPEFDAVKKADPSLAEADFGYFDENQDGKVSRKEFVDKPSVFILRFDKNADCRVTQDELKGLSTGKPQDKPRDRFH
jgi:EF hand